MRASGPDPSVAVIRQSRIRGRGFAGFGSVFIALMTLASPAGSVPVAVTNLITSDQTINPAPLTDADLKNPWGIGYEVSGPFWIAENHSGQMVQFSVSPLNNAVTKGATVTIPGVPNSAGNPTGLVVNNTALPINQVAQFHGDLVLTVSEDGTISGFRGSPNTTAERLQTFSAANVYKGATLATIGQDGYLYAANFKAGTIDVMKGNPNAPELAGRFTDPNLPGGYAPFNIENINGVLYVTYAVQDASMEDDAPGPGLGIVDVYDTSGILLRRLVDDGGALNAPWGLVIAPSSFGALAGKLLIGNFGDGKINVYDPVSGKFLETLKDSQGNEISIDGLWALIKGNGGAGGNAQDIFFTAGSDDEMHGLFGVLTAVPEPSTVLVFAVGLVGVYLGKRRVAG